MTRRAHDTRDVRFDRAGARERRRKEPHFLRPRAPGAPSQPANSSQEGAGGSVLPRILQQSRGQGRSLSSRPLTHAGRERPSRATAAAQCHYRQAPAGWGSATLDAHSRGGLEGMRAKQVASPGACSGAPAPASWVAGTTPPACMGSRTQRIKGHPRAHVRSDGCK
ncbi:hypothetical protein CYMTET_11502 [Cymbomonas tetramitiformis]|uniref:Uncharacterized protein n=1 Tax=Cymbomonas tetramitiformis TaxID=36881 RepID=A0AAE0GMK1_9CHLO|nr:hypothetical protein CYMTET_11502 [Cymbomonas tetramitiformis]